MHFFTKWSEKGKMEKILQYLQETYHPVGILVYGSFAEGTVKISFEEKEIILVCRFRETA